MSEEKAREVVKAYIQEHKEWLFDQQTYRQLHITGLARTSATDDLIEQAKSDPMAWAALDWIADDQTDNEQVNRFFADAGRKGLKKPTKRGRNPYNAAMRNWIISRLVWKAKSQGLPSYSNGNETKLTAVKLVSEELQRVKIYLDTGTITEIWKANPLK